MGHINGKAVAKVGGGALLATMVIMFLYLFLTGQYIALGALALAGSYIERVHTRYIVEKGGVDLS